MTLQKDVTKVQTNRAQLSVKQEIKQRKNDTFEKMSTSYLLTHLIIRHKFALSVLLNLTLISTYIYKFMN